MVRRIDIVATAKDLKEAEVSVEENESTEANETNDTKKSSSKKDTKKMQAKENNDNNDNNDTSESNDNNSDKQIKTRLSLQTPADHPFSQFLQQVKDRGIKGFDPNTFVLKVMDEIDASWWDEQLDELTPLEYKINVALDDPDMREKLMDLLANQKMSVESSASH